MILTLRIKKQAREDQVPCPRSHKWREAEPGVKPRSQNQALMLVLLTPHSGVEVTLPCLEFIPKRRGVNKTKCIR